MKKVQLWKVLSLVVAMTMVIGLVGVVGASATATAEWVDRYTVDVSYTVTPDGDTTIMMIDASAVTAVLAGTGDSYIAYVNQWDDDADRQIRTTVMRGNRDWIIRVGGVGATIETINFDSHLALVNPAANIAFTWEDGVAVPANASVANVAYRGEGEFTFSVTDGTLPTNVTLSAAGVFEGTLDEDVTDTTVIVIEVTVTDEDNVTVSFDVTITLEPYGTVMGPEVLNAIFIDRNNAFAGIMGPGYSRVMIFVDYTGDAFDYTPDFGAISSHFAWSNEIEAFDGLVYGVPAEVTDAAGLVAWLDDVMDWEEESADIILMYGNVLGGDRAAFGTGAASSSALLGIRRGDSVVGPTANRQDVTPFMLLRSGVTGAAFGTGAASSSSLLAFRRGAFEVFPIVANNIVNDD